MSEKRLYEQKAKEAEKMLNELTLSDNFIFCKVIDVYKRQVLSGFEKSIKSYI